MGPVITTSAAAIGRETNALKTSVTVDTIAPSVCSAVGSTVPVKKPMTPKIAGD
jgi:hypothetical protein